MRFAPILAAGFLPLIAAAQADEWLRDTMSDESLWLFRTGNISTEAAAKGGTQWVMSRGDGPAYVVYFIPGRIHEVEIDTHRLAGATWDFSLAVSTDGKLFQPLNIGAVQLDRAFGWDYRLMASDQIPENATHLLVRFPDGSNAHRLSEVWIRFNWDDALASRFLPAPVLSTPWQDEFYSESDEELERLLAALSLAAEAEDSEPPAVSGFALPAHGSIQDTPPAAPVISPTVGEPTGVVTGTDAATPASRGQPEGGEAVSEVGRQIAEEEQPVEDAVSESRADDAKSDEQRPEDAATAGTPESPMIAEAAGETDTVEETGCIVALIPQTIGEAAAPQEFVEEAVPPPANGIVVSIDEAVSDPVTSGVDAPATAEIPEIVETTVLVEIPDLVPETGGGTGIAMIVASPEPLELNTDSGVSLGAVPAMDVSTSLSGPIAPGLEDSKTMDVAAMSDGDDSRMSIRSTSESDAAIRNTAPVSVVEKKQYPRWRRIGPRSK